jgi:hypothetical protein
MAQSWPRRCSTRRATEVAVYVVRAFVQLREALQSHRELAGKLAELERKTEAMAIRHAGFERDTKLQMRQVFEAIRELMLPEAAPPKRPIGFVIPESKRKAKNRLLPQGNGGKRCRTNPTAPCGKR